MKSANSARSPVVSRMPLIWRDRLPQSIVVTQLFDSGFRHAASRSAQRDRNSSRFLSVFPRTRLMLTNLMPRHYALFLHTRVRFHVTAKVDVARRNPSA
jgi:hypothetical protein